MLRLKVRCAKGSLSMRKVIESGSRNAVVRCTAWAALVVMFVRLRVVVSWDVDGSTVAVSDMASSERGRTYIRQVASHVVILVFLDFDIVIAVLEVSWSMIVRMMAASSMQLSTYPVRRKALLRFRFPRL